MIEKVRKLVQELRELQKVESFSPTEAVRWEKIQEEIKGLLNQKEPIQARLNLFSYAQALVDTCPQMRAWVVETLQELLQKGLLESDSGRSARPGEVFAYGRVYRVNPRYSHDQMAQELIESLARLVAAAVETGKDYFLRRQAEVMSLAGPAEQQLSLDQLTSPTCPAGRRYLPTPAYQLEDGRYVKAGGLTVEVRPLPDGRRGIFILDAYGGVEDIGKRLRESGAWITPTLLRASNPFFSPRLSPQEAWGARKLHRLLRLAIEEARRQEAVATERQKFAEACRAEYEALRAKATLSPREFLLEEKAGISIIHWSPGPFLWRRWNAETKRKEEVRVWYLFALVERTEENQIRVVEAPPRLTAFFAEHREFRDPGPEYSQLGKLGVILRRAKQNILKADAKKEVSMATAFEEMEAVAEAEDENGNGNGLLGD